MKVVLVFSTATGNIFTEMMDGVRDFTQDAGWNIQSIKFDGSPFPIREPIKFWSPIGCIVDASGNGLRKDSIPYRAFGKTPVVYIGGDSLVVPPNATCVVHDAHATSEAAARELLAMGFDHFAFLGIKGRNWSLLRKDAFANALRLNGRPFDAFDLSPGAKDIVAGFPCSRRNAEIRFRLATGHSILEELAQARIRIARQLLTDTKLPVSAVAERCGYKSIAHFRDTFRKVTGHNPLEWHRL